MQTYFMQNNSCNACKIRRNNNLNKADENCEIKQQFYGQLLYWVTEKHKINFRVAPQQKIKK
jgi:hypothetical protein